MHFLRHTEAGLQTRNALNVEQEMVVFRHLVKKREDERTHTHIKMKSMRVLSPMCVCMN